MLFINHYSLYSFTLGIQWYKYTTYRGSLKGRLPVVEFYMRAKDRKLFSKLLFLMINYEYFILPLRFLNKHNDYALNFDELQKLPK